MLKKLAIITASLFTLALLFAGGIFFYSSTPSFCRSCHIMEPFYQSWTTSKHNDIACVKCHFEPGLAGSLKGKWQASALLVQYLTNTYSPKPFANIKDASCLQEGCHVKAELGETKPFKGKAAFNHQPHFQPGLQSDLTCTSCHSPLKGEKHISVNETHCYLCHLKGVDWESQEERIPDADCRLCHKTFPKVISLGSKNIEHEKYIEGNISCHECHSHVVKGGGKVEESTCFKCHDFQERLQIKEDKEKLHKIHVVAHVECFLCHDDISHQIDHKAKMEGSDCRSCHLAKHSGVKMLYSGRGGQGVPDKPGPMFQAGVDCIGCHNDPSPVVSPDFKGRTLTTVKQRCVECHNDERYGDILDKWKGFIKTRLQAVGEKMEKGEKKVGPKPEDPKMNKLYQEARYNYFFVKQSPGVHNVGYSKSLLEAAENKLDSILGEEPIEETEETEEEEIFWFEDTEGLAPVRFSHEFHQSMFPECGECHDNLFSMEKGSSDSLGLLTMSNMKRGKYCGHCHNGEEATNITESCDMCHVDKKTNGVVE